MSSQMFDLPGVVFSLATAIAVSMPSLASFHPVHDGTWFSLADSTQDAGKSCWENYTYDLVSDKCCRQCEPGFGVALPCTQLNDTVCSPCVDGITYSPISSHEAVCRPCSQCPSNSFAMHLCNATHNTKCECVEGFYYQPEQNMCLTCGHCGPGEYVTKMCSTRGNTQCHPCPQNTFMSVANLADSCVPCSTCRKGAAVEAACTASKDTRCSDGVTVSHTELLSDESDQNLIVIYCVVFGILLASLIIYVLMKHFQVKSWSCYCYRAPKSGHKAATGQQEKAKLRSSCVSGKTMTTATKDTSPLLLSHETSVSQLPQCLIDQLEQAFQEPGKHDRELEAFASALHFDRSQLMHFQELSVVNGTSTARELFRELCKDKLFGVCPLINALKRAKRIDLVMLVQKSIENTETVLIV
ncbi:hypothetical protein M514_00853 [Trichuris suis]|uniref:TNFR-Cys domain-containing protein n=1 Tax=Trichuris suis TaxID=68888 RepID=A0A085MLJ4_9BILA|nr:hypothetical protein M513_00853 [Trichuris suis]KFD61191.1 hypothetical protein M514_00853 [Trichuris suis]